MINIKFEMLDGQIYSINCIFQEHVIIYLLQYTDPFNEFEILLTKFESFTKNNGQEFQSLDETYLYNFYFQKILVQTIYSGEFCFHLCTYLYLIKF